MATYGSPPVRRSYPVAASDNDRYDEYWPRNTEAVHQCKYAKPVSSASAVFPRNSSGSSPNGWMLYHPQIEMSSSMQVSKMRSEPFFDGTSGSPSAFARKSHQAEHDPCKSAAQSQSMPISRIRNVQVRFPGRAPIAPQQSALKPLLSPIRLSSQTVQVDCGMTGSDSALPILSRSQSDEKIQNEIPSLRIANGRQHDGHVLQRKLHQGSQSKHTIEGNNHVTLSMSPPLEGYELRSPGCEIFSTPMRRTSGQKIQRSIGSRYLRDVADMVDNDGQLETQNSWKSTVSDENSTPTPSKVHIKDGFSCCNEPELRINTMNFEKDAGKAYLTTVTSPPRPQIITIPRRLSSLKPLRDECDSGARSILKPNFTPVTPPQSPLVALGNTVRCEEASIMDTRRRGLERNANELWVPLTPFNSPVQKPRIIRIASPKIPRKSPASLPQAISRQIFTAWTLDELEFSISSFPDVMLQLDSPVIQHLRLDFFNCLLRPVLKNPKSPSVRAPHSQFSTLSRHSIFRPLSSHPTRLCSHQSLESIKPNSKSKHHIDHVSHHTFSANPTLHALQNIFPNASIPTLDSLQATYLAHYYLSTAPLFTQAKPHSSALTAVPNPFISLLDIPPKARETLGMPTSTSNPPHRASWFKPESLVIGDDALHLRIEPLVEGLKRMVRDLLGILEGRRLGKKDEVLVRAVGEVIRLGEVEGQAANDGVED